MSQQIFPDLNFHSLRLVYTHYQSISWPTYAASFHDMGFSLCLSEKENRDCLFLSGSPATPAAAAAAVAGGGASGAAKKNMANAAANAAKTMTHFRPDPEQDDFSPQKKSGEGGAEGETQQQKPARRRAVSQSEEDPCRV